MKESAAGSPGDELPGPPAAGAPLWADGAWRRFVTPDRRLLLLSIVVQVAIALPLGHSHDTGVFMATGYLVGTGQDPYVSQNLSSVFHHPGFGAMNSIGYPPPWPLLLGLLYWIGYGLGHDLFIYGLVIKLPVIAANIGLAYLVAAVLQNLGRGRSAARAAWVFLLFNPLLLYFGAAWGQIDSIVALLALASLVLLYAGRRDLSAVLLALAVCFKPIAAPIALVALVFVLGRSTRGALRYAIAVVAGVLFFYLLPFPLLGWSLPPGRLVNAHFAMSGSLSFMAIFRLVRDSVLLPGHWWLLGLLWVPALAVAVVALRRGVEDFGDLVTKSVALVLVFFLTRTWLAEPDVTLVLPLVVLAVWLGRLDRWTLAFVIAVPLLFTVFNTSPLRLLWLATPQTMSDWLSSLGRHGGPLVVGRGMLAVAWQLGGWWTVAACLRRRVIATTPHSEGARLTAPRGRVGWN